MTDPYFYVSKVDGKYAITLGTELEPPAPLPTDPRYDDLEDAMERACGNREGYAVKTCPQVDAEWKWVGR